MVLPSEDLFLQVDTMKVFQVLRNLLSAAVRSSSLPFSSPSSSMADSAAPWQLVYTPPRGEIDISITTSLSQSSPELSNRSSTNINSNINSNNNSQVSGCLTTYLTHNRTLTVAFL